MAFDQFGRPEYDDDPFSEPLRPSQRRSERAATTEVRRTESFLRRGMGDRLVDEGLGETNRQIDRWGWTTLTGDIFEVLGAGNFTAAGIASELVDSGNVWEAVKRGTAELLTALPFDKFGIDKEFSEGLTGKKVKQESFADVLKKAEVDWTGNERYNGWANAGAGFILDVALDPLTYVGGVSFARGGGLMAKGGIAAKVFGESDKFTGLSFVGDALRGSGRLREGGGEESLNKAQKFINSLHKGFNPDEHIDQWARINRDNPNFDVETEVTRFKTMIEEIKGNTELARVEIQDAVSEVLSVINPDERALINMYAGGSGGKAHFKGIVDELSVGDPGMKERLLATFDAVTTQTKKWSDEAVDVGIMSPKQIKANYWPHRAPKQGDASYDAYVGIMERLGLPKHRIPREYSKTSEQFLNAKTGAFHKAQKYDDNELRVVSAIPTEMDLGVTWAKRSFEQAQEIATKNAMKSWMSDTSLVKAVFPEDNLWKIIKPSGNKVDGFWKTADDLVDEGLTRVEADDLLETAAKDLAKIDVRGFTLTDWSVFKSNKFIPSDDLSPIGSLNRGATFFIEGNAMKITHKSKDGSVMAKTLDGKPSALFGKKKSGRLKGDEPVNAIEPRPIYVVPKEFNDHYTKASEIIGNGTGMQTFLDTVKKFTAPWKGWALVSSGYHARNVYSNVFMNTLGLGKDALDPRHGADSFRLLARTYDPTKSLAGDTLGKGLGKAAGVVGGNKSITLKVKGADDLVDDQIIKKFDELNGRGAAMVEEDLERGIEKEMFKLLRKSDRRTKGNKTSLEKALVASSNGNKTKLDEVLKNIDDKDIGKSRREFLEAMVSEVNLQARGKSFSSAIKDPALLSMEGAKRLFSTEEVKTLTGLFGSDNFMLRVNRKFGKTLEDHAKLTHWITKVRQGASPEDAMWSVKKYLFDYADLTPFERDVMKQVIPFYTWMRKNIPLQFQAIMENPGRYAAITTKPITAIESMSDDWSNTDEPDYFEEINTVRMPKSFSKAFEVWDKSVDDMFREVGWDANDPVPGQQDVPEGGAQPISVGASLPFEDLNRLNLSDWVAALNPAVKWAVELAAEPERGTQISLFGGRPKESFRGQPGKQDYLKVFPMDKKAQSQWGDFFPFLGKVQRHIDNVGKGKFLEGATSELLGIKVIKKDLGRIKRGKLYRKRDRLREILKRYKALTEE
jgi:hypothetical protein